MQIYRILGTVFIGLLLSSCGTVATKPDLEKKLLEDEVKHLRELLKKIETDIDQQMKRDQPFKVCPSTVTPADIPCVQLGPTNTPAIRGEFKNFPEFAYK